MPNNRDAKIKICGEIRNSRFWLLGVDCFEDSTWLCKIQCREKTNLRA